jgi:hypothetical protein
MALVPVGKRHKKVQRQPVGARIRTLDAAEQEQPQAEAGETHSFALSPVVSARVTALGPRTNLVRNVLAAVGLAVMFVAAVWLIIIPKLRSTEPPLDNSAFAQPSPDGTRPDGAPIPPSIPAAAFNPPAAAPPPSATSPFPAATQDGSASPTAAVPSAPAKLEFFRVILASFATRPEAIHEVDAIGQEHPELILHVAHMKLSGGEDLKYVVAVGGVLARGEAEPLQQRLLKKGLKGARLERFER